MVTSTTTASVTTLGIFSFWAWCFYLCFRHERDRSRVVWALILILFSFLGAIVYFFIRYLPRVCRLCRILANRRRLRRELKAALLTVRHRGKAHDFVALGHIHLAMGNCGHALAAYQQALSRDLGNAEALWGSASIEMKNKNLEQASVLLQRLIETKPDYDFGRASIAYGQVLLELGDFNLAQQLAQQHLQKQA